MRFIQPDINQNMFSSQVLLISVTKLGGRHPVTGRKVIEGVGGGSKQKARWIDWLRYALTGLLGFIITYLLLLEFLQIGPETGQFWRRESYPSTTTP